MNQNRNRKKYGFTNSEIPHGPLRFAGIENRHKYCMRVHTHTHICVGMFICLCKRHEMFKQPSAIKVEVAYICMCICIHHPYIDIYSITHMQGHVYLPFYLYLNINLLANTHPHIHMHIIKSLFMDFRSFCYVRY